MASKSAAVLDDASEFRFFPGWRMVAIAAAAQFMSAPGQSYSVAAFKEPMRESLAISETSFSLAYAFATIISGVLLPFLGRTLDRQGARTVLPWVSFLLGLGCLGMSQVGGLTALYFGFSFVRSLGQGALSLISAWLVGEWFLRRRGFATAVSGLGGSLSVMTIPLVNAAVISSYGWNAGWIVLGLLVWGVLLPCSLIVRNRPEDVGLLPDGDPPVDRTEPTSDGDSSEKPEMAWPVADVLRDRTFWKLLTVPATSGMVGTGLIFHAVSLLGSRGVSPGWAMGLISFQAVVATSTALIAGWLTDRFQSRYLLAAAMVLLASSGAIVLWMSSPWMAIVYAVALGLHGSILRSTGMVVWMIYYGRSNQGTIRGIAMAVMILAAAAGPLPLAISIDAYGSYTNALAAFVTIPLLAAALVFTATPPKTKPQ